MKYTFIIIIDDEKKLDNKIKRINILKDFQLILIGTEKQKKIVSKYDNAIYIKDNLENIAKSLNIAKEKATGDYINFSYASSWIEEKGLKQLQKNISNKNDIIIFSSQFFEDRKKHYEESLPNLKQESIINNYDVNQLYLSGYFFKNEIIKTLNFDENLNNESEIKFILEVLLQNKNYTSIKENYCYYLNQPVFKANCDESFTKEWYINSLDEFILPILKKYNVHFIKYICFYLILIRFMANINSKNTNTLTEKELSSFLLKVKECLEIIDDEIILYSEFKGIPKYCNQIFFYYKHNLQNEKMHLSSSGDIIVNNLTFSKPNTITILAINNQNNKIFVDLEYNGLKFIEAGGEISVKLDSKKINLKENKIYSKTLFFDECFNEKYTFMIEIDKNEINNNSKLEFFYKYNDIEVPLELLFNATTPQARLYHTFKNYYWKYEKNKILTYEYNKIIFKTINKIQHLMKELQLYKDFLVSSKKKKLAILAIFLRVIYRITKPFFNNKNIWITFDKLYKGGDNGEYFFQYCLTRKDDIDCYYIINKNAYDYNRLKNNDKVLKFKSLRQYLYVLNSKCVFATHAKCYSFLAFTKGKEKYFRDLFNFDIFCLQHGLTIQDIPHLQNRLSDNTKLYFCASDFEIKNIEKKEYDYVGYNAIKKTGIPRFDGLKNNDKKQILITPTWRSNMANSKTAIGQTRPYYDKFKTTPYFTIYNSLINDKKIIEYAEKLGYNIIYLIHPTLTAQIKDFDKNEYVKIFSVTEDQSYEKLLTESSLMITDYSGVQFDFAYMHKPILYFHPSELPPHYKDGGINYKEDGFGPILKTKDELVKELCKYMENNCRIEEKYIQRSKKFFIYNDYNNCKRIYEETLKYVKERESEK